MRKVRTFWTNLRTFLEYKIIIFSLELFRQRFKVANILPVLKLTVCADVLVYPTLRSAGCAVVGPGWNLIGRPGCTVRIDRASRTDEQTSKILQFSFCSLPQKDPGEIFSRFDMQMLRKLTLFYGVL
jgi:hypothetical protein